MALGCGLTSVRDDRGVREEKLFKHLLNLWICDKKCVKNLYIKNLKCTGRKNSKSDFQLFSSQIVRKVSTLKENKNVL
jgi:hypothetical protein